MKYKNMKVKDPVNNDLAPKEEDFMNAWYQMTQHRQQLTTILQPTLLAIKNYHYPRGEYALVLDSFEVANDNNNPYITITFQCHHDTKMRLLSFVIPLAVCIMGYESVMNFFNEEKRKQEQAIEDAYNKKKDLDKEERRKQFYDLKAEFEPGAIIKYGEKHV